jgi:iron complex outermembrane receptor protein
MSALKKIQLSISLLSNKRQTYDMQILKRTIPGIALLLQLCFFLPVMAQQNVNVTDLKQVLKHVSAKYRLNFIYDDALLNNKKVVYTADQNGVKIDTLLAGLCYPVGLDFYHVDENNYALFKMVAAAPKPVVAQQKVLSITDTAKKSLITGKVVETNGSALEYSGLVLLALKDSSLVKSTLSDSTGKYTFRGIVPGKYLIKATQVGFLTTFSIPFSITEGQSFTVPPLNLQAMANQLNTVTVTARKPLFERRLDRTIVNVENSALAAGGSINDILEIAPGISVDNNQITFKGKQGVTVMIDDKIVKLSSSQLSSLLQSMPASTIDKIELISNPSAKYDAEGKGGLINIITKKGANLGLNGTVTSGITVGRFPRFNEGLTLNYKLRKLNFFSNYSYQHTKTISQYLSDKYISTQTPPLSYHQDETSHSLSHSHNARLGADYDINNKNTVGVLATLNTNEGKSNFIQDVSFNTLSAQRLDSGLRSLNNGISHFRTYGLNINSRHQLSEDGQLLQFNADYTAYRSKSLNAYTNQYYNSDNQISRRPEDILNNAAEKIDLLSAKADYTLPFSKSGRMEAGVKTAYTHSKSNILFQFGEDGIFVTDKLRTNTFDYREVINAAYLNYVTKFGKETDFQAGLRAEHTHYSGKSITTGQTVGRNYLQLFPSLFILHNMGDNSVSFSYSRRIGRPSYEDLNPFIDYASPYFYTQGNPLLKPETTHSFEVNYAYGQDLSISLGYSLTSDYYNYFTSLADSTGATRQTVDNFKNFDTWNLSVSYTKDILKWWSLTANGDFSYDHYQTPYLGDFIDVKRAAYNLNILNSFQFSKALSLEILNLYRSRRIVLARTIAGRYRADAAFKYVFGTKTTLKLGVTDIFYSYINKGINEFQGLYGTYYNKSENRRFNLSIAYKFGGKTTAPKKETSNKDELDRIK